MEIILQCKKCNKNFVKLIYNQIFCSKECYKLRNNFGEQIKICKNCGLEFKSKRKNRKHCSPNCTKQYYAKKIPDEIRKSQLIEYQLNLKQDKERYEKDRESRKNRTRQNRIKDYSKYLWRAAKSRSIINNLEFNIEPEDIIVPEYCPIFNIKLELLNSCVKDSSPTLDRVDVTKGYIKGNVAVISHKANRLKNNGTIKSFLKIIEYIKANSTHDDRFDLQQENWRG